MVSPAVELQDIYGDRCVSDLEQTVGLVRGDLPKLVRKVVAPLIVIDVHARDVVLDMAKKGVSDVHDFDWLAQLRYYPDPNENLDIKIRMISTTLQSHPSQQHQKAHLSLLYRGMIQLGKDFNQMMKVQQCVWSQGARRPQPPRLRLR